MDIKLINPQVINKKIFYDIVISEKDARLFREQRSFSEKATEEDIKKAIEAILDSLVEVSKVEAPTVTDTLICKVNVDPKTIVTTADSYTTKVK